MCENVRHYSGKNLITLHINLIILCDIFTIVTYFDTDKHSYPYTSPSINPYKIVNTFTKIPSYIDFIFSLH